MAFTFPYKTTPYDHQRRALRFGAPRPFCGYVMDQGTGKTKVCIDNAAYLWLEGKLKGMVVSAPSGVHSTWARDELSTHMPATVQWEVFEWDTSKVSTKAYVFAFREFISRTKSSGALAILCINVEATITDNGRKAIRTLLKDRACMLVIDESTDIKTPGAKRTKALKAMGRLARFRRILSGFPAPESPIDWYAQLSFLSPHIVGSSVAAFKSEYCEFEQRFFNGPGKAPVQVVSGFRNLDKLSRIIDEHCFRVLKDDVLDLPPKVFAKHYFEMSKEQWRMYAELREEWETSFKDGAEVTAELTIVRMLRLQQIASGYVPADNDEPVRIIPGPNPRLDALLERVEKHPGPMIIWTRYTKDVDLICEALGKDAVRYDGKVKKDQRLENKRAYMDGDARFFVSNPKVAGRGFTLTNTRTNLYYSQYWGLEPRLQSEDRSHRIGLDHSVLYIDLIASGTIDEKLVKALRLKNDLARLVLGDPKRDWI